MKIGFYLIQQFTENIIDLAEKTIENISDKFAKFIIKKIDSINIE